MGMMTDSFTPLPPPPRPDTIREETVERKGALRHGRSGRPERSRFAASGPSRSAAAPASTPLDARTVENQLVKAAILHVLSSFGARPVSFPAPAPRVAFAGRRYSFFTAPAHTTTTS